MTFSEFGRQIRSNNSDGTDHGTAAPLMLFGPCVKPGVLGDNPQISLDSEPQAGVPMQYDFRSIYATVLRDWIGVGESDIYDILNPEVQFLPLIEGCSLSTAIQQEMFTETHFRLYPNPASAFTTLEWQSNGQAWTATLLDKWGHEVQVWKGPKASKQLMTQRINLAPVPAGHYFIHLRQGNQSVTRAIALQGF